MNDDTVQLIRRAQANDREAFAALFERYKNLVYRSAYLMLGNRGDAEDVLQEVFVQVYRSLTSYDPQRAAFSTWLHRVTINRCLNHRRRRSPLSVPLEETLVTVDLYAGRQEEDEAAWQAVSALSEKLRAVVVLRYYWELSYAEIAQILEIPLGTVKSRLDLAFKLLRRALQSGSRCDFVAEVEVPHEV